MYPKISEERKMLLIDKLCSELNILRIKAELSQEELANIIGISRQTYSSIESGKRKMSWRTYFPLMMYFASNPRTNSFMKSLDIIPEEFEKIIVTNQGQTEEKEERYEIDTEE